MALAWQKTPIPTRGSIPLRPLNKGVDLSIPPQMLPPGQFTKLDGFISRLNGLQRTAGFQLYGNTPLSVPGVAFNTFRVTGSDGKSKTILLTSNRMFIVGSPAQGLIQIYWKDPYTFPIAWNKTTKTITTTGTITIGGVTEAISLTSTLLLKVGDVLLITDGGTNVKVRIATIAATSLTYDLQAAIDGTTMTDFSSATGTSTSWIVSRAINDIAGNPMRYPTQILDTWFYGGDTYITGIGLPLGVCKYANNSVTSSAPITPTSFPWIYNETGTAGNRLLAVSAAAGTFFKSWMFLADTMMAGDRYRKRVIWSDPFNPATNWTRATSYIDIPYTPGNILRLLDNGEQLICYATDAVFYGYNANIPGLPLVWQQYDTGGIGLVNPRALVSAVGSHIFVGQNNVYALTQQGLAPIGTPVVSKTIAECQHLEDIQVFHDIDNQSILFGFPKNDHTFTEVWQYEYISKSWSMFSLMPTTMLAYRKDYNADSWLSLAGKTWASQAGSSWSSYQRNTGAGQVLSTADNLLLYRDAPNNNNNQSYHLPAIIETGDIDLDSPDIVKTWLRLAVKLQDYSNSGVTFRQTPIVFQVYCSVNQGKSWRMCDDLVVYAGKTEGYTNFRMTGSHLRLRLISYSAVPSYTITELVIDATQAGPEQSTRTQGV